VTEHSDNEQTDFVLVDRPRPNVALVTLNRPERMNSMAFDVMVPLKKVLDELTYDNSVRVIVLTGAGRGFSSGADHKSAGSVPHVDGLTRPTYALRSMQVLDDVILGLRRMHQPVIAAVNGAAIGGGLCLALACDIRVAATGAYFRAAGINNGLTASELGLSYLLPRAIGSSRAFELMLTGRDVDASEAERIGLVSRVVAGDDLLNACYQMAEGIAAFSRPGIELTKRTLLDWNGRR
jgi:enoyl-CoA hydratase